MKYAPMLDGSTSGIVPVAETGPNHAWNVEKGNVSIYLVMCLKIISLHVLIIWRECISFMVHVHTDFALVGDPSAQRLVGINVVPCAV